MTREEAINYLEDLIVFKESPTETDIEALKMAIIELQEPERKHGYWFKGEQLFPVCPNCGAIMDGEESNDTKSKEKETD